MDQPVTFAKNLARAAFVATLFVPVAAPVLAGPSETAFLQRLVGSWTGEGTISGEDGGNVACRLTIRPAQNRLNFNGRCNVSSGSASQSFTGRMYYDDAKGAFISTSADNSVVGKKSGNTLTFTTQVTDMRGKGTTTMTLSPSSIKVHFALTRSNGAANNGTIPFRKD
jgi:hypothetical protein